MCLEVQIAISLITSVVIFYVFYYFSRYRKCVKCSKGDAICVMKIVEELMKVCPISPHNQWELLSHSLPRCWKHANPLKLWGFDIEIYGCCVIVNGSSFAAFKIIDNLESWQEWNPDAFQKEFSLHNLDNIEIQDDYMDCAKIVSNGETEYYRFSHLGANEFGWILLWKAKQLSWWWFSLQPLHEYELSRCILTCICGSSSASDMKQLPFMSHSIKDAVELSSISNMPFSCIPEGISCISPPYASRPNVPRFSSPVTQLPSSSSALQLVPCFKKDFFSQSTIAEFSFQCPSTLQKGLPMIPFSDESPEPTLLPHGKENVSAMKEKDKRFDKSKLSPYKAKLCQKKRSKSFVHIPEPKATHHYSRRKTMMAGSKTEEEKLSQSLWFSEPSLNAKIGACHRQIALEDLPEEDASIGGTTETREFMNKSVPENKMNNYFSKDGDNTSEYEILLPNLALTDHRLADMLTKGNYCASQLQAEVLEAAQINPKFDDSGLIKPSNQWSFHSYHKSVILLSKISWCESLKVMSYLCQVDIPMKACDVWKVIRCPQLRFLYDETVKKVRVLEHLTKDQKIIHTYHETGNLLKSEAVDFCLLHTERQEQSKYYLGIYSLEYPNCPLMTDTTRGTLLPSGWVVEPHLDNEEKSKLSYLYQIVINKPGSPFAHDLGNSLMASISTLKSYMLLNTSFP